MVLSSIVIMKGHTFLVSALMFAAVRSEYYERRGPSSYSQIFQRQFEPSPVEYRSGGFHSSQAIFPKEIHVPFPVTLEKKVPYPIKVPIAIPVERPVTVHVPRPYPVPVALDGPFPFFANQHQAQAHQQKIPFHYQQFQHPNGFNHYNQPHH